MSSPILETDIDVQFLQFREHRPVIERTKEIVSQKDVVSPNLERPGMSETAGIAGDFVTFDKYRTLSKYADTFDVSKFPASEMVGSGTSDPSRVFRGKEVVRALRRIHKDRSQGGTRLRPIDSGWGSEGDSKEDKTLVLSVSSLYFLRLRSRESRKRGVDSATSRQRRHTLATRRGAWEGEITRGPSTIALQRYSDGVQWKTLDEYVG
ncbi:hypothetical protein DFH08DRAFT_801163 [Mycena albidolilacea]|uniref:Uncharacterized protein n=1 Tax=Mycena albidolilacea TaxID=1033008 RepID=A0AAD7F0P6_9AGAR|nr:hypothetical protein DFH08DRAFT_801163 [Mycena albidolilacea]